MYRKLRLAIPRGLRKAAWAKLLGGTRLQRPDWVYHEELASCLALARARRERYAAFQKLKARVPDTIRSVMEMPEDGALPTVEATNQVCLDLDRTLSSHNLFVDSESPGQKSLYNILTVHAKFNPQVG